jgi:peptide deformylase
MADRQIRLFGDPVLRTASDPINEITDSIKKLIADLEQATDLPGRAGVAAPQIGVNLRAFSYKVDGVVGHLINPTLIETIGEIELVDEGCLSLPEIWSKTPRYQKVKVSGTTITGEQLTIEAEGLLAQVFQHEIDHLDGKVYLDRLESEARKQAMAALRETSWFISNG